MILAAAGAAENKNPPPPELILAWDCQTWEALPHPGGIMDQPMQMLRRMTACLETYNAFVSMRKSGDYVNWQRNHPGAAKLVHKVLEMRT